MFYVAYMQHNSNASIKSMQCNLIGTSCRNLQLHIGISHHSASLDGQRSRWQYGIPRMCPCPRFTQYHMEKEGIIYKIGMSMSVDW